MFGEYFNSQQRKLNDHKSSDYAFISGQNTCMYQNDKNIKQKFN